MRKVVYILDDVETTSYEKAREIQPEGKLNVRLDVVNNPCPVKTDTIKKRAEYYNINL